MQDLLVLWDAIFADGIGFDLVDYIFVAMLLYIRDHCKLTSCFSFNFNPLSASKKCIQKYCLLRSSAAHLIILLVGISK